MSDLNFRRSWTPSEPGAPNLHRHFYELAVREWNEPCGFAERAAGAIVLLGTAVVSALGQQEYDPDDGEKVPSPMALVKRLHDVRGEPEGWNQTRFSGFIEAYNALRHFADPKHKTVAGLLSPTFDAGPTEIENVMEAAWLVWCELIPDASEHPNPFRLGCP